MGWIPRPDHHNNPKGNSGIALFMVIAAVAMISVVVIEFTYTAQVNKKIAYDSLDALKAHYLAKSGYKISLLRLKAYQAVKAVAQNLGGKNGAPTLPKGVLERIWSFPFMYPIPTTVPGLTIREKDAIDKFQKESSMDGSYSAIIESESSKYNLNQILSAFAAPEPTPSSSPPPSGGSTAPTGTPTPAPSPSVTPFDPQAARASLGDFLYQILSQKMESDADFAAEYRDVRVEDLVDSIAAWADYTYTRQASASSRENIVLKKAPFFSLTELHLVPGFDDRLYDLFAPSLTVNPTPGINVNTMGLATLKALVPGMTEEETKAFFKYRDSEEEDNYFKEPEGFYKYLQQNVAVFRGGDAEINRFKESLQKRQVRLVTEESEFRITVEARVAGSKKTLQAWVTLSGKGSGGGGGGSGTSTKPGASPNPANPSPAVPGTTHPDPGVSGSAPAPNTGLRVTFMRIL